MIRCRYLRDQDRCDTSQSSSTETGDNAGDEDEVKTLSGALECSADESEDGSEEDSVDATDSVCDPAANEAADNGTEIVLQQLSNMSNS
jgi:hypothetical protein